VQTYPRTQSESTLQAVKQVALSLAQTRLPWHVAGALAMQRPLPSHALDVAVLPEHVEPHDVVGPAYAHAAALTPSHEPPHTWLAPASAPAQARRDPCGGPVTDEHAPGEPSTSHAWHCPPQA
jgi:hypothetical protein